MRRRFAGPTIPLVALTVVLATTVADAVTRTRNATATVTIAALAKLSFSSSGVSFGDADPDTVPQVTAAPVLITTKARTTLGTLVTLTVRASGDLASGSSTIPVSAVSWIASGAGFVGGTMSTTLARTVGSWSGSGVRSGSQTYALANAWTYATGNYNTQFLYTLVSP